MKSNKSRSMASFLSLNSVKHSKKLLLSADKGAMSIRAVVIVALLTLGAVLFIGPGGRAAADTDDIYICTVTGGYCQASYGELDGDIGDLAVEDANTLVDLEADPVCPVGSNLVNEDNECPFNSADSNLNATYNGDYIEKVFFPDENDLCSDARGSTGSLWGASCSATAAEMVINQTGGGGYQMINVYDTNAGGTGAPHYVCSVEGNDYDLVVTSSTSGYRCTWTNK